MAVKINWQNVLKKMEIGNGKKMDSEHILGEVAVWLFGFYNNATVFPCPWSQLNMFSYVVS